MRIAFSVLSVIFLLSVLTACGPTPPTETELRSQLMGEYCADNFRLVIEDSTYRFRKSSPGLISSSLIQESCRGTYDLAFENNTWVIQFNKDPRPKGIQSCKKSFVLWNVDQELLIKQDGKDIMWGLFNETPLSKGACE